MPPAGRAEPTEWTLKLTEPIALEFSFRNLPPGTHNPAMRERWRTLPGIWLANILYLLWPPDPIAPPARLGHLLRLDENPPLFGR